MLKKICVFVVLFVLIILFLQAGEKSLVNEVQKICSCVVVSCDDDSQIVYVDSNNFESVLNSLDVEIVNEFYAGDSLIIEGYVSEFSNYKVINNRKVNIQLSLSGDVCLIGYPLIENSF